MTTPRQGTIGVTTDNIFPVIKKFLYSDHEIFLRELVSNAVDATRKLKTLSSFGEFKGDLGEMNVTVTVDKEAGTLTVSDHGIGMTAEDIDKYINQIAFSGAEEFLAKYKDTANTIIGHFGLGFYSAFMVAKKVEIRSLSYKEGAEPVKWECDGSPVFNIDTCDKTTRGTDVILYIDDENKKFLEQNEIDLLLKKYCRFLPVPVISGKVKEWKDGAMVDTDKDNVINSTEPLWTRKPADLTDSDYMTFYHELYPGQEDPLFWIHLNVDYPFTLTGVLFFPKIKNNLEVRKDRIQLYCNQVYVTDSVEGVVPEFMMLLQGVIDSPDIPLNVSRSYLQSDSAVKKISGYITKKVSARLEEIFKTNRDDFEKKWDDIKIFIEYGMLTNQKFCESAKKFALLKDTFGKYYTFDEYRDLIKGTQTDKEGNVVYIYTTDPVAQHTYIKDAVDRGLSVLIFDGQLDSHYIGLLESTIEKSRFVRVDASTASNLVDSGSTNADDLTTEEREAMADLFRGQTPEVKKADFVVSFEKLNPEANPVVLTQNEYMRRMKDMAALQPAMSFYSEMPDTYNMIVNIAAPVMEKIREDVKSTLLPSIESLNTEIASRNDKIKTIRDAAGNNKLSDENQKEVSTLEEEIAARRNDRSKIINEFGASHPLVKQTIDLALLANGLLTGENLSQFIRRSVELL